MMGDGIVSMLDCGYLRRKERKKERKDVSK